MTNSYDVCGDSESIIETFLCLLHGLVGADYSVRPDAGGLVISESIHFRACIAALFFANTTGLQVLLERSRPNVLLDAFLNDSYRLPAPLRYEVAELLLRLGADPAVTPDGQSLLLHAAAADGDATFVALLLDGGVQPDEHVPGEGDWTALMMAAYNGHAEVARILLSSGADAKRKNADKQDARSLAEQAGHSIVVRVLDEHSLRT